MRSIGLDVHRDFCEVAIFEDGKVTRHPRVPSAPGGVGGICFIASTDRPGRARSHG